MASGIYQFSEQEGLNLELGQGGYAYSAEDTLVAYSDDTYIAVTALVGESDDECTVVLSLQDSSMGDSVTISLPVGTTVYGRWSSVAVAANDQVIIYKGS